MSQSCGLPFKISLLHPRYTLTWLSLGIAFIVSFLPVSIRHAMGRKIGDFIYNKKIKRRKTVQTNLSIAFPDLTEEQRNEMALSSLRWYGCALVDYSLYFFASRKRLSRLSEVIGKEHIDDVMAQGKTVMLLLPHSVMLEFAGPQIGFYYDIFGSYKTTKNPVLNWRVARSRCRHAGFVVSREEGLRKLVKSMSPERIMFFLPDEDLGRENSIFAPFYGKEKSTLTTTARLARMAKATVIPLFPYYDNEKKKYITYVGPALENYPSKDPLADAITMNKALEEVISQKPEQYMWFLKWYFTRPEGEAKVY